MQPTIVLVGAGIAEPTPSYLRNALKACTAVVCRTLRHPGLAQALEEVLSPEIPVLSCDDLYDAADDFDQVYQRIVDRILDLSNFSENSRIAYVVPGSPAIGERSVQLLLSMPQIHVEIGAGLGLIDYATLRLGSDPIAGLTITDALELRKQLPKDATTVLALQCFDPMIAHDIVALASERGGVTTMLYHLAQADERILTVDEHSPDLKDCDHLTSLWISNLRPAFVNLTGLVDVVHTLRQRCPWDAEQTHRSLARHLLEEAYEVLEALDDLEGATDTTHSDEGRLVAHLEEELGDLLLQVFMHAEIANEVDDFDLESIAEAVTTKLIRRHPHVFGNVVVDSAEQVVANWETIKAEERKGSKTSHVPDTLPAAIRLQKAYRKATGLGIDYEHLITTVVDEMGTNPGGATLMVAALEAVQEGQDLEEILRHTARLIENLNTAQPGDIDQ